MNAAQAIRQLRALANPANVAGMARYGISVHNTLGVSIPVLRKMAREMGRSHAEALALWSSGIHEARILAGLMDDPAEVTESQMEQWALEFDSWDVCDGVCSNLFDRTPCAHRKALQWSRREEPFVKRAGFVLMAALAVHDNASPDGAFEKFLPAIRREASDGRNFVKKAVNWALRQIGKRNRRLHGLAVALAGEIALQPHPSARWIARDALRELRSEAVLVRLKRGSERRIRA